MNTNLSTSFPLGLPKTSKNIALADNCYQKQHSQSWQIFLNQFFMRQDASLVIPLPEFVYKFDRLLLFFLQSSFFALPTNDHLSSIPLFLGIPLQLFIVFSTDALVRQVIQSEKVDLLALNLLKFKTNRLLFIQLQPLAYLQLSRHIQQTILDCPIAPQYPSDQPHPNYNQNYLHTSLVLSPQIYIYPRAMKNNN